MFLPQCDSPSFILVKNNRQNYISLYFSVYMFGLKTGRQKKFLRRMIASTSWIHSALNYCQILVFRFENFVESFVFKNADGTDAQGHNFVVCF
jgi:hypothetical protein